MPAPVLPGGATKKKGNGGRMKNRNLWFHRIVVSAVFVFLLGCENAPPKIETVILNHNPNPSVPLAASSMTVDHG